MDKILQIAEFYNLIIIEDAAESLGSWYKGRHTGTMGLMGVFSFNGNKTITTGGGGAIITDNDLIARRAKHISNTAKLAHKWNFVHDELGYNYRMPNINAALGCAQMEQLTFFLEAKRNLHSQYKKAFSNFKEFELIEEPENCKSNYWLQAIKLKEDFGHYRDSILETSNRLGLMTRPIWTLINKLKPYADCPHAPLTNAVKLEKRLINLPSNEGYT
jgi:dTDP-4-amino-4,6-dideoxygalactose transaminase